MDSDLDYYQRNMLPSDAPDDDEDYNDYSLEEGWPDEESEAA